MRMLTFAGRNTKEILRDPLNLCFGLGFPLVLILLLSAIQANIPVELYHYIGNSSLAGAFAMALSDEAAEKVHAIAQNMTYVELSTCPGYMDAFVAACFIPHTDSNRFPHSCQEV